MLESATFLRRKEETSLVARFDRLRKNDYRLDTIENPKRESP